MCRTADVLLLLHATIPAKISIQEQKNRDLSIRNVEDLHYRHFIKNDHKNPFDIVKQQALYEIHLWDSNNAIQIGILTEKLY